MKPIATAMLQRWPPLSSSLAVVIFVVATAAAEAASADAPQRGLRFLHVKQVARRKPFSSDIVDRLSGTNNEPDGGGLRATAIWEGEGKATQMGLMDDLEPVAPFDRLVPTDAHLDASREEDTENPIDLNGDPYETNPNGMFVPPYMRPDAFPGTSKGNSHYSIAVPIHNSSGNYTQLDPADITYSSGNFWRPEIQDGLVAPMDRLPKNQYPVQAGPDKIKMVPTVARKDRVSDKFARYADQLEARSYGCDGVSLSCTTPCVHGDRVKMALGNVEVDAVVLSGHVGNFIKVQYSPATSSTAPAVACNLQSGCTVFRPCHSLAAPVNGQRKTPCASQAVTYDKDLAGDKMPRWACPVGYSPCKSLQQIVRGNYLRTLVPSTLTSPSKWTICRAGVKIDPIAAGPVAAVR